jgi:hypothetical protein
LRGTAVTTQLNFAVQSYIHHNNPQLKAFDAVIIDRKRAFLYNKVKKNATKYIKNFLVAGIRHEHANASGSAASDKTKKDLQLLSNQIVFEDLSKYRSLLVVRDPIKRALSAFLDKFSNQKEKYSGYQQFELSPQGFEKFVSWLAEGGLGEDLHWDLQVNSIVFPIKFYTDVIRLEEINEKLPALMKEAGYNSALLEEETIKANIQRNKTYAADKADDWISKDLRTRLERIYERDYNLIGR